MSKIYVVLGTKGGVGKTTTSLSLAQVASFRGLNIEYIELDNSNNTSKTFENSEVFKNKMTSCKISKAQEELFKATFKALKENKTVFIDVGGGTDTIELAALIKEDFSHLEVKYILPFENNYKQMQNLLDTYQFINEPNNTYLVKNKMTFNKDGDKDEFVFFEGSKLDKIESTRKLINSSNKVFEIYLTDLHQKSEMNKESILDTAQLAIQYEPSEASNIFMDEAEDINHYNEMMRKYSSSSKCLKEIERLNEEFSILFEDSTTGV